MGFFDTFITDVTCPSCEETFVEQEVQTKNLPEPCGRYVNKGAFVSNRFKYIIGLAHCTSCGTKATKCINCKHEEQGQQYYFHVRMYLDEEGKFNGKTETIKDNKEEKDGYFGTNRTFD